MGGGRRAVHCVRRAAMPVCPLLFESEARPREWGTNEKGCPADLGSLIVDAAEAHKLAVLGGFAGFVA